MSGGDPGLRPCHHEQAKATAADTAEVVTNAGCAALLPARKARLDATATDPRLDLVHRPPVLPDIIQPTRYGPVRVVARRAHGCHVLAAIGPAKALHWLFPEAKPTEFRRASNGLIEHQFDPTPVPSVLLRHLLRDLETWRLAVDRRITVWKRRQRAAQCGAARAAARRAALLGGVGSPARPHS